VGGPSFSSGGASGLALGTSVLGSAQSPLNVSLNACYQIEVFALGALGHDLFKITRS